MNNFTEYFLDEAKKKGSKQPAKSRNDKSMSYDQFAGKRNSESALTALNKCYKNPSEIDLKSDNKRFNTNRDMLKHYSVFYSESLSGYKSNILNAYNKALSDSSGELTKMIKDNICNQDLSKIGVNKTKPIDINPSVSADEDDFKTFLKNDLAVEINYRNEYIEDMTPPDDVNQTSWNELLSTKVDDNYYTAVAYEKVNISFDVSMMKTAHGGDTELERTKDTFINNILFTKYKLPERFGVNLYLSKNYYHAIKLTKAEQELLRSSHVNVNAVDLYDESSSKLNDKPLSNNTDRCRILVVEVVNSKSALESPSDLKNYFESVGILFNHKNNFKLLDGQNNFGVFLLSDIVDDNIIENNLALLNTNDDVYVKSDKAILNRSNQMLANEKGKSGVVPAKGDYGRRGEKSYFINTLVKIIKLYISSQNSDFKRIMLEDIFKHGEWTDKYNFKHFIAVNSITGKPNIEDAHEDSDGSMISVNVYLLFKIPTMIYNFLYKSEYSQKAQKIKKEQDYMNLFDDYLYDLSKEK